MAAIVTSSVLLFVIFLFSTIVTCRASREKRRFQNRLDRYKTDPNRPEYPMFLSFSSRDQDLVHRFVLPRLNRGNRQMCGDGRSFTRIHGDRGDYSPAVRPIFCISKAFCESCYCRDEVMVAEYTRTPVILMFLEETETNKLPKIL